MVCLHGKQFLRDRITFLSTIVLDKASIDPR